MAHELRIYQKQAVKSIWDYFAKNQVGNPVVAIPTGGGKSLIIADFLKGALLNHPRQKILVAAHVKELLAQNYAELVELWPQAPAGIYSAGLKQKDTKEKIIFCGIASINKNIEAFGKVDLMIVDECHLMSQDDSSMYLKVIAKLKELNPYLRVIGLTATPWRQGQGRIIDDGIFTDVCYDATTMKAFNWFIKQGYLVPLVPKRTDTILDVSGVHLRGGEFVEKELQLAVDKDEITYAALEEAILHGYDRKHWLIFGSGVQHVVKITAMLNKLGISTRCVHSNSAKFPMTDKQRDQNIEDWKQGKFVAMVNNGILTTGVNFRAIDMIVMLRPTHSTVLWIQMLGRGTRPSPETGKTNCLVLDFAQNTKRLGPINDPVLPRKRGEKTGEVPIKICDACGTYNHISARHCGGEPFKTVEGCGSEFIFKVLLKMNASSDELIKNDEPIVETFKVDQITCGLHQKLGKPDSVKVTYWCGLKRYSEYILFEHPGFGARKAASWWRERSTEKVPTTTDEALKKWDSLSIPTHIRVWTNKPYPEILAVTFTGSFEQKIVSEEVPF